MSKKIFFILSILFIGFSGLFAAELSGTYDKDFTVTTDFNTIAEGKTLHVTNGATYVMRDAIVDGSIVVDKGCKFISPDDYEGYLVFHQGAHVEGIDLYYKVRVSEEQVLVREIPMTLDEVWKNENQDLKNWVGNIEFCYSPELNGWVSINEVRFVNPFNENLYENYAMSYALPLEEVLKNAPPPTTNEISGTYKKDYTVKTEQNVVSKGKTLRVKKGVTFIMTDAIVSGSIVVDKGGSLIAAGDQKGYLVFHQGAHAEGIDLYYKVRVSDDLVFTRKLPMTLDEVWKSNNQQLIEQVGNMEFCYSPELKGWVTINEIRFMNPFNENLYEDYDIVFTKSDSKQIEMECRSLIVKNKSKVVVQPNPGCWGTKINESIIVESGSSLLGTGPGGHKLQLKKGIKIQGLPLYIKFDNQLVEVTKIMSDLWDTPAFNKDEYQIVVYSPELKGWYFQDITIGGGDLPDKLKKELEKQKKK